MLMLRFHLWRSHSPDAGTRGSAAFKLIGHPEPEALQRTVELLSDPAPSVSVDAARALGTRGDPAAIGPLIQGLGAPVEEVRENAAMALRRIDPEWRKSGVARAMLPSLVATLIDADSASWTNHRLPLVLMAGEAMEPLAEVLRKGPSEARRRAVSVIKDTADRRAVGLVVEALPDLHEEDVRNHVLLWLDRLDREWADSTAARTVAPRLLAGLESTEAPAVSAAVVALGRIREPRSVQALLRLIAHPLHAESALKALQRQNYGWMRSPEAAATVPTLLSTFESGDAAARAAAARALTLISEPSLGPLLKSFHARYDALPELVALRNLGFESEGGADPALLAVVTGNASLIAGSERLAVERIVEALLDPDSLRQRIAQATLVLLAGKSLPDLAGGDPARLELLTDSAVAALTPGLSSSGMVVWNASDLQQLVRTMAAAAGAKAVDPLLRYLFSCTVDVVRKTTEEVLLGLTSVSALTEELLRSAAGCCSYEVTRDQFAAYAVPDPAFGFLSELIAACSPLTTNLLHLAAEKRDIVVEVTMCSFSYGRDVDYSELRRRAKTELQKRGNPPYRPEAYVKSGGAQFARGELRGRGEEEALRRLSAVTTAAELLPRLGDEHETVRRAAREALDRMNPGWRGSEQAVEARRRFQSALAGPSAHLREAAAEALDSLGWQPGDDTERAWQAFARQDWERLGGLTPAAAQPLLLGLADENPVVCRSVLLILARAGAKYPEALKPLVKALWHSDARLRDLAADALAAFGPDALEAIEEALRSDRIEVRAAGVKLLGKIGDTRALAPLAAALEDPIEWVRGEAVTALNNVDPSWRDSELAQCKLASACASLSDPDRPRRQQAAATLQTLGWSPDSDNERLRLAIATEDWKTLGDIGRAAVAPILDLLGSWDATALRVVLRTLGKIDRDWPVLPGARMALPVLLAMLGEDGQGLRREAAVALGRMREAGAVEPLARLLANEDKETRNAAGIALHRIGAPGIKALLAALKGVDTRARGAAQSVIQKRDPDPAFAAVFEEALADDSPAVRRAAAQYLQRLGRSSGGGEQDPGS